MLQTVAKVGMGLPCCMHAMNTRPFFSHPPRTFNNWKQRAGDEARVAIAICSIWTAHLCMYGSSSCTCAAYANVGGAS